MQLIYNIIATAGVCGLLVQIAYLQTQLNIADSKIADLEFLYDLRK